MGTFNEYFAKAKPVLKKVWNFLIHDNSVWSFIVDAVLIVILGKFVIMPLLGLFLGTSFPIVAVMTSSMDHQSADFDTWWFMNKDDYEDFNLSRSQFESFKYKNGFERGDALVIVGFDEADLKVGDVIVFKSDEGPIIHRIVSLSPTQTKGDANRAQFEFETSIEESRVYGKAVLLVPFLGWPKAVLMSIINLF